MVFTRAVDDRLTSLVKAIDKNVAENKGDNRTAFVVLLDENSDGNRKKLAELAKANSISVPLTIAADGAKGPGAYKLNPDVPITVLVSKRNSVKANFALTDPAPKDDAAKAKEVADILAAADKAFN